MVREIVYTFADELFSWLETGGIAPFFSLLYDIKREGKIKLVSKKSIPPFYFSHFEWSYYCNVHENKRI